MRRFVLVRHQDVSGVSGIGVVAEGIQFSTGRIALTWLHHWSSIGIYNNLEDLIAIHDHHGQTVVSWLDKEC
jgi:hypothetical protein